jgi:hypothetical protein
MKDKIFKNFGFHKHFQIRKMADERRRCEREKIDRNPMLNGWIKYYQACWMATLEYLYNC